MGLGKIVLHLKPRSDLWTAAESLGQPNGHLRGDPGLLVNEVIQCLPLCAKTRSRFRNRETERLDALLSKDRTGMGEFFMVIVFSF